MLPSPFVTSAQETMLAAPPIRHLPAALPLPSKKAPPVGYFRPLTDFAPDKWHPGNVASVRVVRISKKFKKTKNKYDTREGGPFRKWGTDGREMLLLVLLDSHGFTCDAIAFGNIAIQLGSRIAFHKDLPDALGLQFGRLYNLHGGPVDSKAESAAYAGRNRAPFTLFISNVLAFSAHNGGESDAADIVRIAGAPTTLALPTLLHTLQHKKPAESTGAGSAQNMHHTICLVQSIEMVGKHAMLTVVSPSHDPKQQQQQQQNSSSSSSSSSSGTVSATGDSKPIGSVLKYARLKLWAEAARDARDDYMAHGPFAALLIGCGEDTFNVRRSTEFESRDLAAAYNRRFSKPFSNHSSASGADDRKNSATNNNFIIAEAAFRIPPGSNPAVDRLIAWHADISRGPYRAHMRALPFQPATLSQILALQDAAKGSAAVAEEEVQGKAGEKRKRQPVVNKSRLQALAASAAIVVPPRSSFSSGGFSGSSLSSAATFVVENVSVVSVRDYAWRRRKRSPGEAEWRPWYAACSHASKCTFGVEIAQDIEGTDLSLNRATDDLNDEKKKTTTTTDEVGDKKQRDEPKNKKEKQNETKKTKNTTELQQNNLFGAVGQQVSTAHPATTSLVDQLSLQCSGYEDSGSDSDEHEGEDGNDADDIHAEEEAEAEDAAAVMDERSEEEIDEKTVALSASSLVGQQQQQQKWRIPDKDDVMSQVRQSLLQTTSAEEMAALVYMARQCIAAAETSPELVGVKSGWKTEWAKIESRGAKCRTHGHIKPIRRYRLRLLLADDTASVWVTVWDKAVEDFLECKVDELRDYAHFSRRVRKHLYSSCPVVLHVGRDANDKTRTEVTLRRWMDSPSPAQQCAILEAEIAARQSALQKV